MARDPDDVLTTLERILEIRSVDLRTALGEAADAVAAATGAEKVDVFLREGEGDGELLVAVGVSNTPLGRRQRALGLDRLPVANGGRAAGVLLARQPWSSGHVETDPEELQGVKQALGIRSALLVPMDVDGAPRGLLGLTSTLPEAFGEPHARLARSVARWLGLIVHRAEAVERLREQAAADARRAAAEELVTVVAHDLRNYINPVHGRIQLLKLRAQREGRPADLRDAEAADRAVTRLTALLSDMLDMSRIDRGLFELQRLPLDLVPLVREVTAALESPDHAVLVEAPREVLVDGDAVKLRQVVENLVSNAIRHSPAGAPVSVRVRSAAGAPPQVRLEVADRGPGVDPAVADRVFSRFARGSGSGGLGLGMYLAHEIARAHGGTLDFSGAPGGGTVFTLTLPASS
jgi:signal transduction histidine kinase